MVSKTTKWSLYAWPGAEPERLDPPVMAVGGLACMRGHPLEQHIQHESTILYSIKQPLLNSEWMPGRIRLSLSEP